MYHNKKRALAFLVILMMLLPMFPSAAFSDGLDVDSSQSTQAVNELGSGPGDSEYSDTEDASQVVHELGTDPGGGAPDADADTELPVDFSAALEPLEYSEAEADFDAATLDLVNSDVSGGVENAEDSQTLDDALLSGFDSVDWMNTHLLSAMEGLLSGSTLPGIIFSPLALTTYAITFDISPTEQPVQLVAEGECAVDPGTPTMPLGQVSFVGWYENQIPGSLETPFDFSTPITRDLTLYAVFSDKRLVSFLTSPEAGDPTSEEENVFYTMLTPDGTILTTAGAAGANSRYKDNHLQSHSEVAGWEVYKKDASGNGNWTPFDFNEPIYSDVFLRPVIKYYVYFLSDGKDFSYQLVTHGAVAYEPSEPSEPVKAGRDFHGWSLTPGGAEFGFTSTAITESITLHANWEGGSTNYRLVFWEEKARINTEPAFGMNNDSGHYNELLSLTESASDGEAITPGFVEDAIKPYLGLKSNYVSDDYDYVSNSTIIRSDGGTVINVLFNREVYTFMFCLTHRSTTMTFGGIRYYWDSYATNTALWYSFTAKYEDEIADAWPYGPDVAFYHHEGSQFFKGWMSPPFGCDPDPPLDSTDSSDIFAPYIDQLSFSRKTVTEDMIPTSGTRRVFYALWDPIGVRVFYINYYLEGYTGVDTVSYNGVLYGKHPDYSKMITRSALMVGGPVDTIDIEGYIAPPEVLKGTIDNAVSPAVFNEDSTLNWTNQYLFYRQATEKKYLLTLNLMGGDRPAAYSGALYKLVTEGAVISEFMPFYTPVKTDENGLPMIFDGWWYKNGSDVLVTPFAIADLMPGKPVVLYAKWVGDSLPSVVSIYGDASAAAAFVTSFSAVSLSVNDSRLPWQLGDMHPTDPSKGILIGWMYKSGNEFYWYNFEKDLPSGGLELYANWQPVTTYYRIKYKDTDGSDLSGIMDLLLYAEGVDARVKYNTTPGGVSKPDEFIGWRVLLSGGLVGNITYYGGSIIPVKDEYYSSINQGVREIILIPVYGIVETPTTVAAISVKKTVKNPSTGVFVDNLSINSSSLKLVYRVTASLPTDVANYTSIRIEDRLPASLMLDGAIADATTLYAISSTGAATVLPNTATLSGITVSFELTDLDVIQSIAGGTLVLEVRAQITSGFNAGAITNVGAASVNGGTPKTDSLDVVLSTPVIVVDPLDSVTKTVKDPITGLFDHSLFIDDSSLKLTYRVNAKLPANVANYTSVRIEDLLPTSLILDGAVTDATTIYAISSTGAATVLPNTATFGGMTVSFELTDLDVIQSIAEGTLVLEVRTRIASSFDAGTITNVGSASVNGGTPKTASLDVVLIEPIEDIDKLVKIKSGNGDYVKRLTIADRGAALTYRIAVTMPADTTSYESIEIRDVMPAGLQLATPDISADVRVYVSDAALTTIPGVRASNTEAGNTVISYLITDASQLIDLAGKIVLMEVDVKLNADMDAGTITNNAQVIVNNRFPKDDDDPPVITVVDPPGITKTVKNPSTGLFQNSLNITNSDATLVYRVNAKLPVDVTSYESIWLRDLLPSTLIFDGATAEAATTVYAVRSDDTTTVLTNTAILSADGKTVSYELTDSAIILNLAGGTLVLEVRTKIASGFTTGTITNVGYAGAVINGSVFENNVNFDVVISRGDRTPDRKPEDGGGVLPTPGAVTRPTNGAIIDIPPEGPPTAPPGEPGVVTPPPDDKPVAPVTPSKPPAKPKPYRPPSPKPPVIEVPPIEPPEEPPEEPPVKPPEEPPEEPTVVIPPVEPPKGMDVWALLNLICAIISAIAAIVLIVTVITGRKEREEDKYKHKDMDKHHQKQGRIPAGNNEWDKDKDQYRRKRRLLWRLLGVICGILGPIVFILTEDMRNPMVFVDRWTLLMIIIALATILFTYLAFHRTHDQDREDEGDAHKHFQASRP